MSYGESIYGISKYGQEQEKEKDISIYTPDLIRYLPPFLHNVREIITLEKTSADEVGALKYEIEDVINQFFINTATWGLDLWESELGLMTDPSKPYSLRREIIIAKIRGAGTTTKQLIKNVAVAYSGGEVDVIEYPDEYRFEIQFIGIKGIPLNMAGLIKSIEDIKPAHLTYSFKYTYTVWNMLSDLNWQQANNKTWNEIKVYE
ncbi:hypothetical protein SH1V18_16810 [Vallitalea longa]|uniref:DUF2313 domain-containing protein n=1 Tax=Vallitalea longa TaxID=2936439 RepID=A0A9W5YB13_9FIRM|nr:YmfQ family protein [Vallitalea longa]GKX29201.1 hypothetical protein SH1V18_16810 [Vallitalea longa]